MSLSLESARFDNMSLGVSGSRSPDGRHFSLLFDRLFADSQPQDESATPQCLRVEGLLRCAGQGWLSLQVRGGCQLSGGHGMAQALVWANGRRIALLPDRQDEPLAGATTARVGPDGELRLSLLLLAQRDLADPGSGALCWIDSIDLSVIEPTRRT